VTGRWFDKTKQRYRSMKKRDKNLSPSSRTIESIVFRKQRRLVKILTRLPLFFIIDLSRKTVKYILREIYTSLFRLLNTRDSQYKYRLLRSYKRFIFHLGVRKDLLQERTIRYKCILSAYAEKLIWSVPLNPS
jgi:hypothetical protein